MNHGFAKPGAFRVLLWKEWRQQRWTLAGMTALGLALFVLGGYLGKRWSFGLSGAAYVFVLLGVPLGVKAHRKESSVGVALALFLIFVFYLFVILAETLVKHPEFRPDLIIWVPVLICIELGIYLLKRFN